MKKIRFVTLFPCCPNFGLVKDVGQIPINLGRYFDNVETYLVSYQINEKIVDKNTLYGLNIISIHKIVNEIVSGIFFLLTNSRKIDWLNIYHPGRKSYYWNLVYKILNPEGKTYLKLDLDYNSCEKYVASKKERILFKKVTESMDIVSVETEEIKKRIQKYTRKEIIVISNGYCETEDKDYNVYAKKNYFITVGRLGTEQKATDILLEAFALSSPYHNWKLLLVGTVEKSFGKYIKEFFDKFPQLVNRIDFIDNIEDREELYTYYAKSKVLVLSSRWESFALVGPEAVACGCNVLVTEAIPSKYVVTNNEEYGCIVKANDSHELAVAMISATKDSFSKDEIDRKIEYAKRNFSWKMICNRLYSEIRKKT